MNSKILIPILLVTGLTAVAASTFAATSSTSSTSPSSEMHQGFGSIHRGGHMGGKMGPMTELTQAEQTALSSMTDAEKKAFFEKKHTEMEAKRDAREAVIDKLLAGKTLTSEEETLRQEIITERAAHKAEEAKMKAERDQIKAILDKKAAGTTLTADEQKILDSMPKMGRHHEGHDGMMGPRMNDTQTGPAPTTAQ